VSLNSGDLTVTRPWQRHRVGDPHVTAGRLHWLILDVGVRRPHQAWHWPPWLVLSRPDLRELADRLRHNEQPVWHAGDDLRQCVRRLAHVVEADPTPDRLSWVALYLNELFLLLLRLCRRSPAELDSALSSSLRTVELFLAELRADSDLLAQEWTLPHLAAHCGLGVTRFVHHCRQLTESTPMHYLAACRLDAAREQLRREPDLTITEVAARCGFASSQYFATLFGRRFGEPPGAWRARMARQDGD
jgi:AraC family L-rhamnose operon regulatory protein RhaS